MNQPRLDTAAVSIDIANDRLGLDSPLLADHEPARRFNGLKLWVPLSVAAIAIIFMYVGAPARETVGMLAALAMLALMAAGVPIGLAMVLASTVGLFKLGGLVAVSSALSDLPFSATASWSLSVIPLFILMGVALSKSGLTRLAYESATAWLGRLPGGLAIATNFSGAGLAAASGSSIGISYALGRVAIPEMLRVGYKPSLATGTVAAVGTLGQLIPPSILLVVYAGVAQTAVGPQLLAAVVPGIVLALAFGLMIFIRALLSPDLAPRSPVKVPFVKKLTSSVGIVPIAIVVAIVIVGMYQGIFTPTEAGAVGAIAALLVGWLARKENRSLRGLGRLLRDSLFEVATATAGVFLLLIGVVLLTRVLTLSHITTQLAEWIIGLGLSTVALLLILVVVYLILGMFLDPMAMVLLTVPVLVIPLQEYGINMIWFGVFLVILGEVGLITPPVGILNFVVARLSTEPSVNLGHKITLVDVFKGVIWFVIVALCVVLALIAFPEMALWLPSNSAAG